MRLRFYLIVFIILSFSGLVRATQWQRAEVSFIDWDIETRAALSPDRVRQRPDVTITVRTNVSAFVASLEIDKLKKAEDARPEDARLVIDLVSDSGERVTYYASRFHFCTTDNALKRPIDEHFRDMFRKMAKHAAMKPNQSAGLKR